MSRCPNPEELALYAGDDHARPGEIAAHMSRCPSCAELVQELRNDRDLLRAEIELSDGALGLVRERVLADVSKPRTSRWIPAGLVAAGIAATVAVWTLRVPPAMEMPRASPPAVVAVTVPAPAPQPKPRKPKVAKRKNEELFAKLDALMSPEPLPPSSGIEIQTADPNITIILLEESTGEDE